MAAQRAIMLIPVLVFLTQLCIIEVRAVDGNWGAWLEWDPCSASCGEGQRRRMRFCNNPPPSNGGAYCAGRAIQYQECEAPIGCPDTPVCASPPDIEGAITPQLNHPVGTAITYSCPYGFKSRNSSNHVSVCTFNPITGRPEWTAPEISCIDEEDGDFSTTEPSVTSAGRETQPTITVDSPNPHAPDANRTEDCFCTYEYEDQSVVAQTGQKALQVGDRIRRGEIVSFKCRHTGMALIWQNGLRLRDDVSMICNVCKKWQRNDVPTCKISEESEALISFYRYSYILPGGIAIVQKGVENHFYCYSSWRYPEWDYGQRKDVVIRNERNKNFYISLLVVKEHENDLAGKYECFLKDDSGQRQGSTFLYLQVNETNILCPPIDTSGVFTLQYSNNRRINSTVTFSCKDGAEKIEGSSSLNCLPNGTWSGQNPKWVARPGYVELEHVNITVNEDSGTLQVNVIRIDGTDGILILKYKTLDVSAVAELDYVPVVGDLVFKDGESKRTISIFILNDDIRESLEAFQLQIFDITPGPGIINFSPLGTKLITHINIIDDDARPGYVELEHVNITVNEDSGTLQVNVIRIGGTDGILILKYKTLDVSAVAELDYVPVVGDLVFKDGESKKTINIFILNDDVRESLEAFQFQIFDITPGPGIFNFIPLGTKLITHITIIDDDELFYEPCGTNRIERETNMPLVTGMTNATEGTWPWMAAIQKKDSSYGLLYRCTGFLIDKKHVVSAARCFRDKEPHLYAVLLGSVNYKTGEKYTVTRIVVPRGYAEGSYYDDIAILTLSRDVDIPNFVPVCLPDNQITSMNLTGTRTTVAGWNYFGGLERRFLKQRSGLDVPSNEECETQIRNLPSEYPRGLTSDIFCVRSGNICWVNPGSPLMLLDRNRWYAVFILSYQTPCHTKFSFDIYTRVTSYLDWIRENTRD